MAATHHEKWSFYIQVRLRTLEILVFNFESPFDALQNRVLPISKYEPLKLSHLEKDADFPQIA